MSVSNGVGLMTSLKYAPLAKANNARPRRYANVASPSLEAATKVRQKSKYEATAWDSDSHNNRQAQLDIAIVLSASDSFANAVTGSH